MVEPSFHVPGLHEAAVHGAWVYFVYMILTVIIFYMRIYPKRNLISKQVLTALVSLGISVIFLPLVSVIPQIPGLPYFSQFLLAMHFSFLVLSGYFIIGKPKLGIGFFVFFVLFGFTYLFLQIIGFPVQIGIIFSIPALLATILIFYASLKRPSFVLVSMFLAILTTLITGLLVSFIHNDKIYFIGIIPLAIFSMLFLSVFKKPYEAPQYFFISILIMFGGTIIEYSLYVGSYTVAIYFASEFIVGLAALPIFNYFLKDFYETKSTASLGFSISLILLYFLILMDMFVTFLYDVVEVPSPIEDAVLVTIGSALMFSLATTSLILLGRHRLAEFAKDSGLVVSTAIGLTYLSLESNFILYVIFFSLLGIIIVLYSLVAIVAYRAGARGAAIRFTFFVISILILGVGLLISTELSAVYSVVAYLISSVTLILSSPIGTKLFRRGK